MKQYIIFGDTAFAERIYKYICHEGLCEVLCFTNEKKFLTRETIAGLDVVPFEELSKLYDKTAFEILICIGYVDMNRLRERICGMCKNAGYSIGTWISNTVVTYSDSIGEGCIIMPNVYVGPNCTIGKGNIIASCTCLSHDNKVGEFNFISSNVIFGGYSILCNNSFIGLGSVIRDGITINDYSLIGSATNLLSSTEPRGVYVGNPSHKLEGKDSLNTKI